MPATAKASRGSQRVAGATAALPIAVVVFAAMSDLEFTIETSHAGMEEVRPALDAALMQQFPGGMLQREWVGDTLHLSGPGARGTITWEAGRLVGRATLGPPASMMRKLIEEKISAALRQVAG